MTKLKDGSLVSGEIIMQNSHAMIVKNFVEMTRMIILAKTRMIILAIILKSNQIPQ